MWILPIFSKNILVFWTPLNPNWFCHHNHIYYFWWKWYLPEFYTVNRIWIIHWQAGHVKKAAFCEDKIIRALFHRNTIRITLQVLKAPLIFPQLSIHIWCININSLSSVGSCELCKTAKFYTWTILTMAAARIILSLFLFPTVTSAGESCRNVYSQGGYALVDHAYKLFFAGRLASCYMSCTTQPTCQSLNYNLADKTCELNNDTKYFRPKYFVKKPGFVYTENPGPGKSLSSCFLSTKYVSLTMHQFSLQFIFGFC